MTVIVTLTPVACHSTHLVLFQSTLLFHVGAILPSDNGLNVCNRNWETKGISLCKVHAVRGSLHRCWEGSSSPQTKGLCQFTQSGLVLVSPPRSLPGVLAC